MAVAVELEAAADEYCEKNSIVVYSMRMHRFHISQHLLSAAQDVRCTGDSVYVSMSYCDTR
jgi:hypothetical protein